jgi:CheY-like chemotaxis protein
LSLARRLIELHGGTVSAYSEGVGKGSTFTVRLPASDGPVSMDDRENLLRAPGSTKQLRILVVDDNQDVADGLAALLETDGHHIRQAYDGAGGLEEAIRFEPDIVFCDVGMPGMSGHEVARELRSTRLSKAPLLVAVSGWGSTEDRRLTLEAGFDIHCTKPITAEQVDLVLARF